MANRDRTEARDLQDAVEGRSVGRGKASVASNEAAEFCVRCPSCDHENPAGSRFCNQCGMPVDFEACRQCEAINRCGAAICHKCGCVLRATARREPAATPAFIEPPAVQAATPAIVEPLAVQAADRIESNGASPPHVAEPALRRRRAAARPALIALGLALVAVPTYIAIEYPPSFHRIVDAVTGHGNAATDSPPSMPGSTSRPSPPETSKAPTIPETAQETVPVAPPVASEPRSDGAAEVKSPPAAASGAVAPSAAKSARSTTTAKSGTSRSKQTARKSTRKPAPKSP